MNIQNRKNITRILKFIILLKVLLLMSLYHTQIIQNTNLSTLASKNYTRNYPIEPIRGSVYDRHNTPLVVNQFAYHAFLSPSHKSHHKTLPIIQSCLFNNSPIPQDVLTNIHKKKHCCLKKNLSTQELVCLRNNQYEKIDITVQRSNTRHYPTGQLIKRVIGITSTPSPQNFTKAQLPPSYLALPFATIGQTGLELLHDQALRGQCGRLQKKVNAQGETVQHMEVLPPENGMHLKTTINSSLQQKVEQFLLTVKAAHAVVMHIPTGQILAMVSHDPHDTDQRGPSNKTISGLFPPGSIFKLIVAYTAMRLGLDTFTTECSGELQIANHTIHCWKKHGHGKINLQQALSQSCNIFFYRMGLQIGAKHIIESAIMLGLGEHTFIDLPFEKKPILPQHNTTTFEPYSPWYAADTAMLSIGHGRIALSPLHITQMVANLIRGYITPPCLALNVHSQENRPLPISKNIRSKIIHLLHQAVNHPLSTAYTARLISPKYAIGGKTSTAQVVSSNQKKSIDLPYMLRSHSIFTGIAPTKDPFLAITVIGEHEVWGSGFAAHAGHDILKYALELHDQGKLLSHD